MTTITELEKINLILNKYRGGYAKIWAFKLTHSKIFLRLKLPKQEEIIHIVAADCSYMNGPFSWDNADLSIVVHTKKEASDLITYAIDKNAGFKLTSSGGIILAQGTEREFAEYFSKV